MQSDTQLLLFITGTGKYLSNTSFIPSAGTGKSRLIEVLANELTIKYGQCACVLAASTGLAALGIGGITLHAALSIPVKQTGVGVLTEIPAQKLQELRQVREAISEIQTNTFQLYKSCKCLIIDEISMVSNETLVKVHHRLTTILGTSPAREYLLF